jgi:hypothetical protein
MWIGIAITGIVSATQLVKSFRIRHQPEPPNSRLKLPFMILLLAGCAWLVVAGTAPVLFSILAAVVVVGIGFILSGRNPWWMQGAIDKRERVRYTSLPPRDLEID